MSEQFSFKEIRSLMKGLSELEVGNSIRTNHDSSYCSGSSKALKITRKNSNEYHLTCYRCGKFGYYSTSNKTYPKTRRPSFNSVSSSEHSRSAKSREPPKDATENLSEFSVTALKWLYTYLSALTISSYGFKYSRSLDRLIIPVYNIEGKESGFITRRLSPKDHLPKYMTYTKDTAGILKSKHPDPDWICVVVEDIVSALVVNNAGFDALPLIGSSIAYSQMNILTCYKKVVVAMDNDHKLIKLQQIKIKDRLNLRGIDTTLLKLDKDPKEYSPNEVRKLIL